MNGNTIQHQKVTPGHFLSQLFLNTCSQSSLLSEVSGIFKDEKHPHVVCFFQPALGTRKSMLDLTGKQPCSCCTALSSSSLEVCVWGRALSAVSQSQTDTHPSQGSPLAEAQDAVWSQDAQSDRLLHSRTAARDCRGSPGWCWTHRFSPRSSGAGPGCSNHSIAARQGERQQPAHGNTEKTAKAVVGPHPCKCSKNMLMWHLRTWFSGEQSSGAGFTVALDDLRGLFLP